LSAAHDTNGDGAVQGEALFLSIQICVYILIEFGITRPFGRPGE
jgi:hypothetical protein